MIDRLLALWRRHTLRRPIKHWIEIDEARYDCAPIKQTCPTCGEKNVTETCGLYASKHDKCYACGRGIY